MPTDRVEMDRRLSIPCILYLSSTSSLTPPYPILLTSFSSRNLSLLSLSLFRFPENPFRAFLCISQSTVMVSADAIRTAVGIAGNVISFGLFLSPLPTFYSICKKKSVEQFSPAPYLATLINCMMWVVYGLPLVHEHSMLVITINGAGTAIELVYVLLFIIYSPKDKRLKVILILLAEIAFVGAVAAVALTLFHSHERRSLVVGVTAVLLCIMMYAAPLSVMRMVIKTKSVEYMPFSISLASFFNGLSWTTYALIRIDCFIIIPNSLGMLSSIVQLIMYGVYYKSTQKQMEARKAAAAKGGEIGLEEVVVAKGDAINKVGSVANNTR